MAHTNPNVRSTFLYVVVSIFIIAAVYNHYLRHSTISTFPTAILSTSASANYAVHERSQLLNSAPTPFTTTPTLVIPSVPSPPPQVLENLTTTTTTTNNNNNNTAAPILISTTAVLLPDWDVIVIVSPNTNINLLSNNNYMCLFDTNEISSAQFSGVLPFPDRATFTCKFPLRARWRLPFNQPALIPPENTINPPDNNKRDQPHAPLLRWSHMVYDSLTTDNDVVLFVKGLNNRQGINRHPNEFRCVFGNDVNSTLKTDVTTSMQEVFRCKRPQLTSFSNAIQPIKVSLEVVAKDYVVPSLAYYAPAPRRLEPKNGKSLLCATTMVYDVAKFLREWVLYHSKVGVDKFLLYDNMSDDELGRVVDELVKEGFDISTYYWRWPKTQEAGFSHSAVYARDACTWMMYTDVDEFVHSPSWHDFSQPSKSLLHSLISTKKKSNLGQVSIGCHEFGPSGQRVHPVMGVTQGYNCRRKYENRHKSIVLLDVVDDSLLNVIHHFSLKPGYKTRKANASDVVVNHYKYQAWPEFKAKFRRRVSAYVLDWTQKMNPNSNDRTPGLGFAPIEPEGWPQKFCEVHDNKLKDLTLKWFGIKSSSGYQMAWQTTR